jgi:hypothetical protein
MLQGLDQLDFLQLWQRVLQAIGRTISPCACFCNGGGYDQCLILGFTSHVLTPLKGLLMSNENPYAPSFPEPSYDRAPVAVDGEIRNVVPEFGDIFRHAWNTWKDNLGLLVGATLIVLGVSFVLSFGAGFIQALLQQQGKPTFSSILVGVFFNVFNNVIQIFLGIGEVKMVLALLRGQPSSINTLFSGGERFLPTLGFSILFGLLLLGGLILLIIPFFILLFMFWPAYYLVVDRRTPVMQSFGLATEISRGNTLNTLLLTLSSMGIGLLGFLACGVGILFAQPLAMAVFGSGYLMMSGQLDPKMGSSAEPPVL